MKFARFTLRTTDLAAARGFYDAVLGTHAEDLAALPAAALARGAQAHWLGQIDVEDVGAMAARLVALGAAPLGPQGEVAIVRDPGGAIVGLTLGVRALPSRVVWHQRHTAAPARDAAIYAELFGWRVGEPVTIGEHGVHRPFSWRDDGVAVGTIADLAGRPHVHAQWLFYFGVPALETAMAAVRAGGGIVLGPWTTPDGARVAVCDDPQGAAFGLMERATA
ncbi:MAG: hypothetical protein K8W52_45270 [Deltaproteobacteria bacterium]|nr:hypothetical protein [Deltaproteobacteria bacterium]